MRKYLLAVCTFFVQGLSTSPTSSYVIRDILNNDDDNSSDQVEPLDDIVGEDTLKTSYVKKGGVHSATWYNPHGSKTASGERFHKDSLTCAYNFSKMQSLLKVTNVTTKQSVLVRVTDRMGIKSKNHIDLSKCAFDSIGNPRSGRINVTVEEVIK